MKQAGTPHHEAVFASRPMLRILAGSVIASLLAGPIHARQAHAQTGSPAGPVPVERLESRRAALLDAMRAGVAIIHASEPRSVEGDYPQDSDYRERNDFFYLTGLEAPGAYLVLVAGTEVGADRVMLYLPPRSPQQEQWTGPRLGPGPEATALTGIDSVLSVERIRPGLDQVIAGARKVWAPLMNGPACGGRSLCSPALDRLGIELAEPEAIAPLTASLRHVKDDDEMRRLRRAIDITAEAQREAMRSMRPGMYEYEIEATIEYTFRRRGAERVGFPSIVGSGPNSVILHYDRNRRQTQEGDLVVMDIGAEWGYYTADVTRTVPVTGTFTRRQREVYELVLGAQQAAINAVRPGITINELNAIARRHIDGNSGDICGGQSCNRHFLHGLSHWLGMDVHDVGDYSRPLEAGMVLTIEPGIYIASENLGVRIEDDILVTDAGHEILSAAAPRTIGEIERIMADGRNANAAAR